tara:strand:+ start:670 stop:918 length:249 start_codon:yes stop_codon:yes gene_type:complete
LKIFDSRQWGQICLNAKRQDCSTEPTTAAGLSFWASRVGGRHFIFRRILGYPDEPIGDRFLGPAFIFDEKSDFRHIARGRTN